MNALILSAILAAPLFGTQYPKTPEVKLKHVATGFAAGTAGDAVCVETSRALSKKPHAIGCALATFAVGTAMYFAKEKHDTNVYWNNRTLDAGDLAEGIGGMTVGIGFMTALVEW